VTAGESAMTVAVLRLLPGMDLKQTLQDYCVEHQIDAACIVSCVGSLKSANIRFADCKSGTLIDEKLEIVSLVGTLSQQGCHLHIAVSNGQGQTFGGHLMPGSYIYTTAEIILGKFPDIIFTREHDASTGYKELIIKS
jgi:predicted DNA-binding protein with PD1-like motif